MSDALGVLASRVLDPVFAGTPFGGAEQPAVDAAADAGEDADRSPWPEPEQSVQLLWCGAPAVVRETLPGLWSQVQRQVPEDGGCVDVTVDLDVLGRFVAADIEAMPLADLLRGVGEVEAAAAAAELPGLAAEVAVPALADLFERLFAAAR